MRSILIVEDEDEYRSANPVSPTTKVSPRTPHPRVHTGIAIQILLLLKASL